jgi:hypothetical protein
MELIRAILLSVEEHRHVKLAKILYQWAMTRRYVP